MVLADGSAARTSTFDHVAGHCMGDQGLHERDVGEVTDAQDNLPSTRRVEAGGHGERNDDASRAGTAELTGELHATSATQERLPAGLLVVCATSVFA
jgi:hypothetical protein